MSCYTIHSENFDKVQTVVALIISLLFFNSSFKNGTKLDKWGFIKFKDPLLSLITPRTRIADSLVSHY